MREWERNCEEQNGELHSNTSVYSPNTKVHRGKSERERERERAIKVCVSPLELRMCVLLVYKIPRILEV